jgi:signal transduction histidine kinase
MTIRVRVTVAAALVVGLALVGGALILVALLASALTDQVCADARDRAAALSASFSTTGVLPKATGPSEPVQVIDRSGAVVGAAGERTLAAPGNRCAKVEPPGYNEDFIFAAAPVRQTAAVHGGATEVVVGRPLVDVLDSTRFVTRVLVIGVPVMLLIVGGVTWIVTGRMMAPVTAIRREVDEISAAELHRRVPAAPGRDEIGRLAATMNRMLDRLQRAQDSQRRFVSDASHELRSPIASIRQHAEVALAHPDRSSLEDLAATVLAENLRIQRLVDDLLLLARTDEQHFHLPTSPVDLDDLVLAEAQRLREATNLLIDTSAVSAGQVVGDEASLRRMILNLGENSARYARERIVLAVSEAEGQVVLTVSDDGPGIPPADRERVFERFVRLTTARGRGDGGSGLGLSIVAEITRLHSGTVRALGSPLGGATFEVRLPL